MQLRHSVNSPSERRESVEEVEAESDDVDGHEDQEPERVLERLQERDELRGAGLLQEEKYQTDIVRNSAEGRGLWKSSSSARPQSQYIKHSARQNRSSPSQARVASYSYLVCRPRQPLYGVYSWISFASMNKWQGSQEPHSATNGKTSIVKQEFQI